MALAESCFSHYRHNATGARIDLLKAAGADESIDRAALLFGESPSRIVVSVKPENVEQVQALAQRAGAACAVIGEVGGSDLQIMIEGETVISRSISELEAAWRDSLPTHLDRQERLAAD